MFTRLCPAVPLQLELIIESWYRILVIRPQLIVSHQPPSSFFLFHLFHHYDDDAIIMVLLKIVVDEADISSLHHQPAINAFGILWAGWTAQTGNAFTYISKSQKNRNSKMLCLIRMVLFSSILK